MSAANEAYERLSMRPAGRCRRSGGRRPEEGTVDMAQAGRRGAAAYLSACRLDDMRERGGAARLLIECR